MSNTSRGGESPNPKVTAEAREFDRLQRAIMEINDALQKVNTRMDSYERRTPPLEGQNQQFREGYEETEEVEGDPIVEFGIRGQRGGFRGGRGNPRARGGRMPEYGAQRNINDVDRNLGGIKLKLPTFAGKTDPDAYLEWEKRVDLLFDCHNFSEDKKVKLAVAQFTDYAIVWWDQLAVARRRHLEPQIETWYELKSLMRRRFVPKHYYREVHQKLQTLRQGSRCVEDYNKEFEVLMTRADLDEDQEATMARFLAGLNRDIANLVDLQPYGDMVELVNLAIKVEKQLRSQGSSRQVSKSNSNSKTTWNTNWNADWRKDTKSVSTNTKEVAKTKQNEVVSKDNKSQEATKGKNREIKCFKCLGIGHIASQCPNRRTMVIRDHGEVETESDKEDSSDDMPPLEECSDEEIEAPLSGGVFVTRRILSAQGVEDELQQQRDNLFHTRCLVQGKVCSMIIDGGSCTNVASSVMVERLGLTTIPHPHPYKL